MYTPVLLIIMWLDIGTPKPHHFPFGTNEKVVGLGVPILKHFRVQGRSLTCTGNVFPCAAQMDLEVLS